MSYKHLEIERQGSIAKVTFNRPEKANALSFDHLAEIEALALSFRDDAETRVVVFTGAGRHFSSGADLTDAGEGYRGPRVLRRRRARIGERAILALHHMDQITIAAWNGAAVGGGACITTALDFRVGADDCYMHYAEIEIGRNLQWQALPLIARLAGPARAKRLVVGGEKIYAPELEAWGILDHRVPGSQLMDRALEMAELYASRPPIAAQMIKSSVNAIVTAQDEAIMHMDFDQQIAVVASDDTKLAQQAYLAKQKPEFSGN